MRSIRNSSAVSVRKGSETEMAEEVPNAAGGGATLLARGRKCATRGRDRLVPGWRCGTPV